VKLCIWYRGTDGPWGGSNSFLTSLANCFAARGIEVVSEPSPDCAAVILNSFTRGGETKLSPETTAAVRALGRAPWWVNILPAGFWLRRACGASKVLLIHRCDGVTRLYGRNDNADEIQFAINALSDATVFQSEYCRVSFADQGIIPRRWSIVHNGVDTGLFRPTLEAVPLGQKLKLAAVSWSSNVCKGFALLSLLGKRKDVEMSFVGNWNKLYDPGRIHLIAPLPRQALAEFLRTQNGFVHAAENDPCSNALIEALASGLPALYHPSGGTPELAEPFGCALNGVLDEVLGSYRTRYAALRGEILARKERFSISLAADGYLALVEKLRI